MDEELEHIAVWSEQCDVDSDDDACVYARLASGSRGKRFDLDYATTDARLGPPDQLLYR